MIARLRASPRDHLHLTLNLTFKLTFPNFSFSIYSHSSYIIIITSCRTFAVQDIGLPHRLPVASVGSALDPPRARGLKVHPSILLADVLRFTCWFAVFIRELFDPSNFPCYPSRCWARASYQNKRASWVIIIIKIICRFEEANLCSKNFSIHNRIIPIKVL